MNHPLTLIALAVAFLPAQTPEETAVLTPVQAMFDGMTAPRNGSAMSS